MRNGSTRPLAEGRNRILSVCVLLPAVFAMLSGCAALRLSNAEAPSVAVSNVALGDFSLAEQALEVTLEVSNPNAFSLPVDGIDYALQVDGETLADGATNESFTLPANGRETVTLSVTGDVLKGLARYQSWRQSDRNAVDYVLSGSLRLVGVPVSLPFSHADSVSLTSP